MKPLRMIALIAASMVAGLVPPAMAKPIDLTSGTFGTISPGQSFVETRGVDVRNLGVSDLQLTSMTLNGFNSPISSGPVAARVYDSATQQLIAGDQTMSAVGTDLSVTFPVSVILEAGKTYRICFYVNAPAGSATVFDPNPAGVGGFPYTESVASFGALRIVQAYSAPGDVFPVNISDAVPFIILDVQGISDPVCFTDAGAGLRDVYASGVAWGDYDNDGDQDLLLTGGTSTSMISRICRNGGGPNPTFTDIQAGLLGVYLSSVAWGDYDNDGDLDILLTGWTGSAAVSKIYRSSGGANPTFTDIGAALTGIYASSVAWGDYDNDGDLDILAAGDTNPTRTAKVYRNNGGANPTFTDISAGLIGVRSCSVAWGDYDLDGDLDILLTGDSNPSGTTRLYRNSGGAFPTFSEVATGLPAVLGSSVAWGDYDNDGDLDILIAGSTISRVYRNSGGANPTFADIGAGLTGTQFGSAAWGDYDSDGDLDILLTGNFGATCISQVYRSNGGANPTFTDTGALLPGFETGSAAWADYDGDQDLDVLLTGSLGGWQGFTRLFESDCTPANTPPGPPTNLSASFTGQTATFTWSAGTDAETPAAGLSYNIRVGTSPGAGNIVNAMADGNTGYRRIPALGNRGPLTSWTLRLPGGTNTYYWSVQSVDGSFAGSAFAAESSICGPPLPGIPLPIPGIVGGGFAWGDYDRDGDLDLFLSGTTDGTVFVSRIYRNNGGIQMFADIAAGLPGVVYGTGSWGDCDADGDLDLLMNGYDGTAAITRIYRNSGGANPTFTDMAAGLTGTFYGATAWADADNDGDLDVLITGHDGAALVARLYRSSGGPNPTFTDMGAGLTPVYYSTGAAWADYDEDGDLDVLVTGDTGTTKVSTLYRNSGGSNPTFTDAGVSLPGVWMASADWGDYDADGDLDLFLTGKDGSDQLLSRIYRNSGGANPTFSVAAELPGVWVGTGTWGDYDNDGDLDILLLGEGDGGTRHAAVYESSGGSNPVFSDIGAGMTGVQFGMSRWADHDRDGDLDILYTGGSGSAFLTRLHLNVCNPTNTVPQAPTNLGLSVNGTQFVFTWSPATDTETPAAALSYNLRIGTTPGGEDILSPAANTSTGFRRLSALGNVNQNTTWEVELPGPGPYYWSVQAIDGAFAGSPFAPEQSTAQSGVEEPAVPLAYAVSSAGPNPFSAVTSLRFSQPAPGRLSVQVFDLAGRPIRRLLDEDLPAGSFTRTWDGRDDAGRTAPSGLYFVRMKAGTTVRTHRMSIVR